MVMAYITNEKSFYIEVEDWIQNKGLPTYNINTRELIMRDLANDIFFKFILKYCEIS